MKGQERYPSFSIMVSFIIIFGFFAALGSGCGHSGEDKQFSKPGVVTGVVREFNYLGQEALEFPLYFSEDIKISTLVIEVSHGSCIGSISLNRIGYSYKIIEGKSLFFDLPIDEFLVNQNNPLKIHTFLKPNNKNVHRFVHFVISTMDGTGIAGEPVIIDMPIHFSYELPEIQLSWYVTGSPEDSIVLQDGNDKIEIEFCDFVLISNRGELSIDDLFLDVALDTNQIFACDTKIEFDPNTAFITSDGCKMKVFLTLQKFDFGSFPDMINLNLQHYNISAYSATGIEIQAYEEVHFSKQIEIIVNEEVAETVLYGYVDAEDVDFPCLELKTAEHQFVTVKEFKLQVIVEPEGVINVDRIVLDNYGYIFVEINSVSAGDVVQCYPFELCFNYNEFLFPRVELSLGPNAQAGQEARVSLILSDFVTEPAGNVEGAPFVLSHVYEIVGPELSKPILFLEETTGYYSESPHFELNKADDIDYLEISGFTIQAYIESDKSLNGTDEVVEIERIDFTTWNFYTGGEDIIGSFEIWNEQPTTFSIDDILLVASKEVNIVITFKELEKHDTHIVDVKVVISDIMTNLDLIEGLPLIIKAKYSVSYDHPPLFLSQYIQDLPAGGK